MKCYLPEYAAILPYTENVEGFCTCGAKLPEDALFCHRCGRQLREIVPVEEPEAEPEVIVPAAQREEQQQQHTEINFRNGVAVRVGFLVAAMVQLGSTLSAMAGAGLLMPVILFAGGVYAVLLYRRRTGALLTTANGVRIGWMTGVFCFVIMTVFFTLGMALLAGSDQLLKTYQESAANLGLPPDAAQQLEKLLKDPAAFGLSIIFGLALQFLLLTVLSSLGGLVGAKLRPASPPPPQQR